MSRKVGSIQLCFDIARICHDEISAGHLEVFHEVATHQIVGVAESCSGLPMGREKQTRILDGVAGKNELPGANVQLLAIESTHAHSFHCAESVVGFYFNRVCMGVEMH